MISPIRGTSHMSLSGSLSHNAPDVSKVMLTKQRLINVFPEANQRVFAGIVAPLAGKGAYQFNRERFHKAVVHEMWKACKVMYPEGNYPESSSYTILYIAISNFLDGRDKQIRGIA